MWYNIINDTFIQDHITCLETSCCGVLLISELPDVSGFKSVWSE